MPLRWLRRFLAAAAATCVAAGPALVTHAQGSDAQGLFPDDPIAQVAAFDELVPRTPAQVSRSRYFVGQGRPVVAGQVRRRGIIDYITVWVPSPPPGFPPDPVCDAQVAFIGQVKARRVFLNHEADGLFSEVDFSVEVTLRGDIADLVSVATNGGAVRIGTQAVTADLMTEGPLWDHSLVFAGVVPYAVPSVDGLIVSAWGWVNNGALDWVTDSRLKPQGSRTGSISEIANTVRSVLAGCPRR